MQRPDLTGLASEVAVYIEYLETELGRLRATPETRRNAARSERESAEDEDPSLPPLVPENRVRRHRLGI